MKKNNNLINKTISVPELSTFDSSRNRITLPKAAVAILGLKAGDKVCFSKSTSGNGIIVKKYKGDNNEN